MIICVARNNLALTKRCVETLTNQAYVGAPNVLVLDNASTDGTKEWLRSQVGVRSVSYGTQQSLSRVWNDGLKWASTQSRHVLVVNNDVELWDETYRVLLREFKGPGRFPTLVKHTGERGKKRPLAIVSAVSVREWNDGQCKISLPWYPSMRPHPDFSCFMIDTWAWRRIGWFDERFEVAYCEDNDYHVRVVQAGYRAVCVDVPFLHHGAQTVKRADPDEKARITDMADKNRRRFWEKWGFWPGSKEYADWFKANEEPVPKFDD